MDREELDSKLIDYWNHDSLSEAERLEIESWIAASDENRLYHEELRLNYLRQHWFFRERLIKRVHFQKIVSIARRRRLVRSIVSVAASGVVILSLFIGYHVTREGREDGVPVAVNLIQPGGVKAKLLLSTREQIMLDGDVRTIRDSNHVLLSITDEGALDYRNNKVPVSGEVNNRLVVERGGEYKVMLADGSIVWMNSASELEYPVVFTGERRVVKLKGEAYFQVQSDVNHPFVVMVEGMEVKAVGTEFNVNARGKGTVEAVLVKGVIGVGQKGESVMLHPHQLAIYDLGTGAVDVKDVDVEPYVAWKNGDFIFSNERLETIMDKLSLWYDCEVFFASPALKDERLSGDMKRYGRVDELLRFFETSTGLTFKVKGKTIVVE